jgi:hypothetical protein
MGLTPLVLSLVLAAFGWIPSAVPISLTVIPFIVSFSAGKVNKFSTKVYLVVDKLRALVYYVSKETTMKMPDYVDYYGLKFEEPPRIANRTDALELLDILINANDEDVIGVDYALEALKDAIEREVV